MADRDIFDAELQPDAGPQPDAQSTGDLSATEQGKSGGDSATKFMDARGNAGLAGATFDTEDSGARARQRRFGRTPARARPPPREKDPSIPDGDGAWAAFRAKTRVFTAAIVKPDNMPKLQMVFVGLQLMMYIVWVLMWLGWVTNHPLYTMQAVCFVYVFLFIEQFRRMASYRRMCRRVTFSGKGQELDFYNTALAQLKFHGQMVLFPMIIMIFDTLLFTFSFIEGCSFYNVRSPPAEFKSNLTLYNSVTQVGSRGCTDDRALNYHPTATGPFHTPL
jgi:hypothetical protein|eukprot:COSAG01_NODE_9374_length_2464_cov_1.591543_1_plen_277_part_00